MLSSPGDFYSGVFGEFTTDINNCMELVFRVHGEGS